MSKYPIGPKTMAKAAKTEAGKLAIALNRVLYSAGEADIMMKSHTDEQGIERFTIKTHKYICNDKVFRGDDDLPRGVPAAGQGGSYFATEQLLLVIRDYLEAASIREVCE